MLHFKRRKDQLALVDRFCLPDETRWTFHDITRRYHACLPTSILQGLLDATIIAKKLFERFFSSKFTLNKRFADSLMIRKWREFGEKQCHEMCKRVLSDLLNFVITVLTSNSSIVQSSTNLFLFIERTRLQSKFKWSVLTTKLFGSF